MVGSLRLRRLDSRTPPVPRPPATLLFSSLGSLFFILLIVVWAYCTLVSTGYHFSKTTVIFCALLDLDIKGKFLSHRYKDMGFGHASGA